jgi:hypothetical protein
MLYTQQQNTLLAYTKWTWCFFLKRVHCARKQEKSFCDLIPMPGYCIKSFTGNGKVRATKEDKATTRMEKSFFTRVVWKEGDDDLGSEQERTIMIVVWNRLKWVGTSIAFSYSFESFINLVIVDESIYLPQSLWYRVWFWSHGSWMGFHKIWYNYLSRMDRGVLPRC